MKRARVAALLVLFVLCGGTNCSGRSTESERGGRAPRGGTNMGEAGSDASGGGAAGEANDDAGEGGSTSGSAGSVDLGGGGVAGSRASGGGGSPLSGGGGVAGAGMPPSGWHCLATMYGDGTCHCGCGVVDSDCADATLASCEFCGGVGSCTTAICPSSIVPDDNSRCAIPPTWICVSSEYGDHRCDCGCGAVDIDCEDASASACEACPLKSCTPLECEGRIKEDDNAVCRAAPDSWTCDRALYNDGSACNCGCGFFDPDCSANDPDVCDSCDDSGSCSVRDCPGLLDPENIALCDRTPPDGWLCSYDAYGDFECDCGCGPPDADCFTNSIDECDRCTPCVYDCPGLVDPADPTECVPPPPEWACDADRFIDNACDCGCDVADPDCLGIPNADNCNRFPVEGCSMGFSERIDPFDNAKCL